jgi:hypothetical protein
MHVNAWKALVNLTVAPRRPASQGSASSKTLRVRARTTHSRAEIGRLAQRSRLFRQFFPVLNRSRKVAWICEASVLGLRTEILRVRAHCCIQLRSWSKSASPVAQVVSRPETSPPTFVVRRTVLGFILALCITEFVSYYPIRVSARPARKRKVAGDWTFFRGVCKPCSLTDTDICQGSLWTLLSHQRRAVKGRASLQTLARLLERRSRFTYVSRT